MGIGVNGSGPTLSAKLLKGALHVRHDLRLGLGPNPAAIAKARDQPTVTGKDDTCPVFRQTCFLKEAVQMDQEKLGHGVHDTRYSVEVNTRHNVDARSGVRCYPFGMVEGWRTRLKECIEADKWSLRGLALSAGVSVNYVQQLLKDGKEPSVEKLEAVLAQLGPGPSHYIRTGERRTSSWAEVHQLLDRLPDRHKDAVLMYLDAVLRASETEAPEPLAPATASPKGD